MIFIIKYHQHILRKRWSMVYGDLGNEDEDYQKIFKIIRFY